MDPIEGGGPPLIRQTTPGKLPPFIVSLLLEGWLETVLKDKDDDADATFSPSTGKPFTRTDSARVTEAEYRALEGHAWASGKTIGDSPRDCLLRQLQGGPNQGFGLHLLTELVGVQLLLTNTLDHCSAGAD